MAPDTTVPLPDLVKSTKQLLDRFQNLLASPSQVSPLQSPPDPLAVLKDASTLVKAHATKLGLLLLNKPFTASAVAKVLSEVSGACIPAMMGAVELPGSSVHWGASVEREVKNAMRQMIAAVGELVMDIERVSSTDGKSDVLRKQQSDSTLASTGQVWSACDTLIALAALGPAGIVCRKADEYRALLRDAIDELKEFSAEEDEGYSDDAASDQDSDVQFGPGKLPQSRPELRSQIEASVKKLGLLEVAYKAVAKRRLKTFPFGRPDSGGAVLDSNGAASVGQRIERLDKVMSLLKEVPEEVDELAGKYYEMDSAGATSQLARCCTAMTCAVDMVKDGWDDSKPSEQDIFAAWVDKWKGLLL